MLLAAKSGTKTQSHRINGGGEIVTCQKGEGVQQHLQHCQCTKQNERGLLFAPGTSFDDEKLGPRRNHVIHSNKALCISDS